MKKLMIAIFMVMWASVSAQDVFQKQLFSTDLILKYQEDIDLSEDKIAEVKKIYNDHITTFNIIKWDLDADMSKMSKLLSAENVDEKESKSLMNIILEKEEQLKKMRFDMMVKLKNLLSAKQQLQLHEFKAADGEGSMDFMASINENPRVSFKIKGEVDAPQPLIIIKDRKGRKIKSAVDSIDPDDIQSITVIKNESAINEYGEEGKNGVVIIVMK
ncbi:MAG: hypothetical protein AAF731_03150 [Bacteroidota bacterium]